MGDSVFAILATRLWACIDLCDAKLLESEHRLGVGGPVYRTKCRPMRIGSRVQPLNVVHAYLKMKPLHQYYNLRYTYLGVLERLVACGA